MIDAQHGGGFSVDASVCIGSDDRVGLERLLRYCARPPFAMERLHPTNPPGADLHAQRPQGVGQGQPGMSGKDKLLYHCPKPQPGGKQGDTWCSPR